MTAPQWSGKQWRATHTSLQRDGKGFRRFQCLYCGARMAALTFPLIPFLSLWGRGRGNVQRRDPRSPNPSRAAPGVARSAAGTCG
ncbi:MAG: hypothetical protein J7460_15110 [Chloroflexus sp.]|nr:hypothetical protein [Chloroflexus sp.]